MQLRIAITHLLSISMLLLLSACSKANDPQKLTPRVTTQVAGKAVFERFRYEGKDQIFEAELAPNQFQNPIVAGFFPDPSITRKGDDFYMVHSTFSYAPGVPILHSTDLINWQLIGHALSQESQLDLEGQQVSRGIFAPTIRYHDGLFYMITTRIDGGGNFIVTAKDPAGTWSDPIWLPEINGIDPDIFFDDDGKVYITHNDAPQGEVLYEGHRAIWLWEFDLAAKKVVADSGRMIINGGVDLSKQPIWIEAPHIYKIDGWYYLLCAEGGTADQHSEVVFRSRDLSEPFIPYQNNPILTQRTLDENRINPITTAGHADLIQTSSGEWWAVFLATRTYDKSFYNTGRETFLLPVSWKDGWPHIWPEDSAIPYRLDKPAGLPTTLVSQPLTGNFVWLDEFDQPQRDLQWLTLRGFDTSWYNIEQGAVSMTPKGVTLMQLQQPALLVKRQQHMRYSASTTLQVPASPGFSAGLVAMQNEQYLYYLGIKRSGAGLKVFLEQAKGSEAKVVYEQVLSQSLAKSITFTIEGDKGDIRFAYQLDDKNSVDIGQTWDGKILSTQVAQGFVGTMLGIHSRLEKDK
ncbi:glycoside hydrolase family 43 protein [Aliiglaciecola sp. LCG003]|uniref:glycoside hydrolase family 43 protein n=1 Tax=Aliiglaciecola sp. LCG003 TaxID=3053655 RepID=UPI0025729C0B|nr:glycoside hydrolase family 43 protein [Aliiglaciecola sp. LCG003]WJG09536.1 glycoside hydrolase family 43 protein [Aliiglaciecola sp. LCG003]